MFRGIIIPFVNWPIRNFCFNKANIEIYDLNIQRRNDWNALTLEAPFTTSYSYLCGNLV